MFSAILAPQQNIPEFVQTHISPQMLIFFYFIFLPNNSSFFINKKYLNLFFFSFSSRIYKTKKNFFQTCPLFVIISTWNKTFKWINSTIKIKPYPFKKYQLFKFSCPNCRTYLPWTERKEQQFKTLNMFQSKTPFATLQVPEYIVQFFFYRKFLAIKFSLA